MTNLTSLLIGVLLIQRNSTKLDMHQGALSFPSFSLNLEKENRTYPNVFEPVRNPVETTLQTGNRTIVWVKS